MTKFIVFFTTILFLHFKVFASETKGVITTIQPINSLVSAVIGNTGKTTSLIPAEISPHEFKLKPSDVKKMQEGDIIFLSTSRVYSINLFKKKINLSNIKKKKLNKFSVNESFDTDGRKSLYGFTKLFFLLTPREPVQKVKPTFVSFFIFTIKLISFSLETILGNP